MVSEGSPSSSDSSSSQAPVHKLAVHGCLGFVFTDDDASSPLDKKTNEAAHFYITLFLTYQNKDKNSK